MRVEFFFLLSLVLSNISADLLDGIYHFVSISNSPPSEQSDSI